MKYLSSRACILLLAAGVSAMSHAAQDSPVGCVEVSVGGYKAPDYNCLSQQMGSPQGAEANQKNQEALKAGITRKAPNQVGLATPAATSIRMGNTFGTSVKPQRPTSGQ